MCGIFGIFNFTGHNEITHGRLRAVADTMIHRGPDDQGYLTLDSVGLAMRRLSIIDVSGGHQPLCDEEERIWIVYNGEIYNTRL